MKYILSVMLFWTVFFVIWAQSKVTFASSQQKAVTKWHSGEALLAVDEVSSDIMAAVFHEVQDQNKRERLNIRDKTIQTANNNNTGPKT